MLWCGLAEGGCGSCIRTGGMPSLVSGYICIMCEVWFHSFGVLGFLWSLCVRSVHFGWCCTVEGGGRGGVLAFWLLVNLARKEKRKPTDLKPTVVICTFLFANNRCRRRGR